MIFDSANQKSVAAFAGVMLATALAALDQTIVATAIPQIVGDLDGFEGLSWTISAYLVAATVTIPIYGGLSDLYGRRRLFVVAITVFVAGSMFCALCASMGQLIAARAVQGLGAGGLIPLAQATIADMVSPRERGRYQGYVASVWAGAAVLGPLAGGVLTDVAGWRWIFLVNLPLGALALAVVARTIPDNVRKGGTFDLRGAALLIVGATGVLVGIALGGERGWDDLQVAAALAAGVALLLVFVRVELHDEDPLLPLGLFRLRTFALSAAACVTIGALLFISTTYVPVFVQGVLSGSATRSGVVVIPLLIAWPVTSIVSGQIVARTGRYKALPIAGSLLVGAGVLVLIGLESGSAAWHVAGALILIGGGMGLMFQVYVVASQSSVKGSMVGITTAVLHFSRSIGGTAALAGMGAVLSDRTAAELGERLGERADLVDPNRLVEGGASLPVALSPEAHAALADALHTVFLLSGPIALAGLAVAILLPEQVLRDDLPGSADAAPGLGSSRRSCPAPADSPAPKR